MAHPVSFDVAPSARMARVHVAVRLLVFAAVGSACWSSAYWLAYLGGPIAVAIALSQRGTTRCLVEDAPSVVRVLRWLAGAFAYLWLLTDELPSADRVGAVDLRVETTGMPTPGSALTRLVTSLPGLIVLAVLTFVAALLWVVAAIAILVTGRPLAAATDFIARTLCYRFRFIAYHLSLVQEYPAFEDAPAAPAPRLHGT